MTPLGDVGRRLGSTDSERRPGSNRDRAAYLRQRPSYSIVVLPVVVRGAPLRDDFEVCLNPRFTSGPARLLRRTEALGAVRAWAGSPRGKSLAVCVTRCRLGQSS